MKRTVLALAFISPLLISLLLVASFPSLKAVNEAPQVQWSKTFGYATAYGVTQAGDGNLLIAAQSAKDYLYVGHLGFQYNNLTGVLIKVNLNGEVLGNESLPILPKAMMPTNDGYFVVAGEVHTFFGYSETDVSTFPIEQAFASLTKINRDGTVVWNQTYNLPGQPIPNPAEHISMGTDVGAFVKILLQTSDGGYLIGGSYSTQSPIFAQSAKPWLIKTDASGNSIWTKVYGVTSNSDKNYSEGSASVSSATQTTDSGFLLVGNINGLALTKTDASGNIVWGRYTFTSQYAQNYTTYRSIARAPDGGYVLTGEQHYYIDYTGTSWAYLAKLDDSFNQAWNVTYDKKVLYDFTLRSSSNDSYLFSAYNSVVKTDLNGDIDWSSAYTGTVNALCPTADGGYAVAGQIENYPQGSIDTTYIWVEKLASDSPMNPSPSPTPLPNQDFSLTIVIAAVVIACIVVGVVYFKKRTH